MALAKIVPFHIIQPQREPSSIMLAFLGTSLILFRGGENLH